MTAGERRRERRGSYLPPRKRFGQHFLERPWADKLIQTLHASSDQTFLEIGPGRGALTIPLAARVRRVIGVEIDRDLAASLPAHLPSTSRIVTGDFLDIDLADLLAGESLPIRVVGNLPYNVSSPILFALLRAARFGTVFSDATIMLQREVAERLIAPVGSAEYGSLAVQIALLADVERVLVLPPGAFRPPPKVTSAVVRLTFRPASADVGRAEVFERIVRGVFLQRRKTLLNALAPVASALGCAAPELIARAGLDPDRRPQQLSVADFARLSQAVL